MTYLVQTWDDKGALTNHYEVQLDGAKDLTALKAFLKEKHAHFALHKLPRKAAPRKR